MSQTPPSLNSMGWNRISVAPDFHVIPAGNSLFPRGFSLWVKCTHRNNGMLYPRCDLNSFVFTLFYPHVKQRFLKAVGEEELPQLGKEPLALLFCCLLLQFREGPGWEVRKEARDFDRSIPGQSFLKVQVRLFLSTHPNVRTEPGYLSLMGPYAHTTYRTWPRVTHTLKEGRGF